MKNNKSRTVFLSYAHADAEKAKAVYDFLRERGFEPWLDTVNLLPGQTWRAAIERAIRSCGAFLSLISPSSVDRGGVLSGEMKLALDLRAERLDDGGFLIPLRLERCPLPKELAGIQALDWFAPGAPERLAEALAPLLRKPAFLTPGKAAVLAGAAVAIAMLAFFFVRPGHSSSAYEAFLRARHGSSAAAPDNTPPQLGLTLWRVSRNSAGGGEGCGALRFDRQPLSVPVHTGDRLRLDVQSSKAGYIYVISQEMEGGGKSGAALLLFPVNSINAGRNRIEPGSALIIPPGSGSPGSGDCNTLQLTRAGEGERVSVYFSAEPIRSLQVRDQPYALDAGVLAALEAGADRNSDRSSSGSVKDVSGVQLPESESRDLGYTSAGPDVVFTFREKGRPAYVARVELKTSQ